MRYVYRNKTVMYEYITEQGSVTVERLWVSDTATVTFRIGPQRRNTIRSLSSMELQVRLARKCQMYCNDPEMRIFWETATELVADVKADLEKYLKWYQSSGNTEMCNETQDELLAFTQTRECKS